MIYYSTLLFAGPGASAAASGESVMDVRPRVVRQGQRLEAGAADQRNAYWLKPAIELGTTSGWLRRLRRPPHGPPAGSSTVLWRPAEQSKHLSGEHLRVENPKELSLPPARPRGVLHF